MAPPRLVLLPGAAVAWPGVSTAGVPMLRVHGGADRLLPATGADVIVPGAGHLVALTHPQIVAAALGRFVASVA